MFNVLVIAAALLAAMTLRVGQSRTEALARVTLPGSVRPVSEQAEPGNRTLNFLLVGTDSSAGLDPDDPIRIGRSGAQLSDVIIVARLEEATSRLTLFSIPRDLWVPLADGGSENRINAAYSFDGPAGLIDTIRKNMDIEIDYFISVDFVGFQRMVEVVGGVHVFFPAPARDWDTEIGRSRTGFETLEAGCQFLDPVEALAYARSRHYQTMDANGDWATDMSSDLGRIRRQQDFIRQLLSEAISDGARNPFVLSRLVDETLDAVVVDDRLTAQLILDLAASFRSFEASDLDAYSYPAENGRAGSKWVLFGREDDAEPVLRLMRGASPTDPATVRLVVEADPEAGERADELVDAAKSAGFDAERSDSAGGVSGISLVHGPDGRQAAELVRDALADSGHTGPLILVEDPDGYGRTVRLLVGPGREAVAPVAKPAVKGPSDNPGTAADGGEPILVVPSDDLPSAAACG